MKFQFLYIKLLGNLFFIINRYINGKSLKLKEKMVRTPSIVILNQNRNSLCINWIIKKCAEKSLDTPWPLSTVWWRKNTKTKHLFNKIY